MRNLKKFLALVLAMAMAFSLMLTVNAANPVKTFDDAGQITEQFVEAADVLTGMKVFQGDDRGFAPSDTITRAEVAALIYRLATGDVDNVRNGLYANYGNFADVNEGDWFAGYVGYCANAGYIKGTSPTTFNPYGKVTGYEVLAMILRAIGYDKNHEFEGGTWQTNVSALSTQLGILNNIKTTDYGNTLHLASRRDVVADLLFQAVAYVPMVTYTTAFGYQQTGMTGGVVDSKTNPTLGYYIFGLYNNRNDDKTEFGAVLGNQETGENGTVIGYSGSVDEATIGGAVTPIRPYSFSKYTYKASYLTTVTKTSDGTSVNGTVALGDNLKFDLGTGIDLVGHQVDIWYNQKNLTSKGYQTYAYFDEVVLAEVVKVKSGTDTDVTKMTAAASNADSTNLYSAMSAKGFTVGSTTSAYWNNSYGRFSLSKHDSVDSGTWGQLMGYDGNGATLGNAETSPEYLYMVVSNSASKAPDAVIALNLQTASITGVDNINSIPSVTVPFVIANKPAGSGSKAGTAGNTAWPFIATNNILTATANTGADIKGGTLEQKQLVGNSAKTLGQKEIGLHITGTNAAADPASNRGLGYTPARRYGLANADIGSANFDRDYFKLTPVTQTKDGVVVAYNNSTVTLQDGTVLEKSIVYDTVVTDSIPQVGLDAAGNDLYEHTNYRFYLNDAGKFVGAERMYGTEFIYGTYVDYSQELNSSAFKYFLTGVKLDGTTTTVPVSKLAVTNNATPATILSTAALGVPFRDGGNVNNVTQGIGIGVYRGFSYGSDVANWTFAGLNDIGVVAGANGSAQDRTTAPTVVDNTGTMGVHVAPISSNALPEVKFDGTNGAAETFAGSDTAPVTIGTTEVTLGATFAGYLDVNGTATASDENLLYFTENTKFILVSGYGTDSLKAEVFNGITELKGDSTSVSIDFDLTATQMRLTRIYSAATAGDMTYFTESPFIYAQNQVLSRQADVIVLPAAAVSRTGASNLRYVGNATPTMTNSNAVLGYEATRFTMYKDGVAEQVWIQGLVRNGDTANTATTGAGSTNRNSATLVAYGNVQDAANRYHDHFWNIVDTGLKANDGEPIYTVTPVYTATGLVDANQTGAQNVYVASTYSAQTGSFTTDATITGAAATTRMRNVASANITNLNKDNPAPTWPGITDLATLNEAGSLGLYGTTPQYGGNTPLKVSFQTSGTGSTSSLTVTQIYVCYQQ